ncbi:MAG: hypothetical protein PHP00_06615 [Thiotrichaceae bacterium]|nr:hypothetical protein [Thiotrichaceae bacterium]
MMNLSAVGKSTLDVEVSHISAHGIWLLTDNQELFIWQVEGCQRQPNLRCFLKLTINQLIVGFFINANYQITSKA